MSAPSPVSQSWSPCPSGVLTDLARAGVRRARRRLALRVSGYATLVMAGVGISFVVWSWQGVSGYSPLPQRVTCRHVVSQFGNYLTGEVSDAWKAAIERHLNRCHSCEDKFVAVQQKVAGFLKSNEPVADWDEPLIPIPDPGPYPQSKSRLLVHGGW